MSKSYVSSLLGLYSGILADVRATYPDLHQGLDRDYSRLVSLSQCSGEKVFTLHLPALNGLLTEALETGRLCRSGQPLTRSAGSRTLVPRLFQGLWSRVIDYDGCLLQDIDPNVIFFLRQLFMAAKKFRPPRDETAAGRRDLGCSETALYASIKEYFDVERALPPASHLWDTDGSSVPIHAVSSLVDRGGAAEHGLPLLFRAEGVDSSLLDILQQVADRMSTVLGEYIPSEHRFKHGPGAVSDLHGKRRNKYAFPNWSSRLQHVFPKEVFAIPNMSVLEDGYADAEYQPDLFGDELPYAGFKYDADRLFGSQETHSRLIAVPKTQKTPRLIAAEPTAHQWCQQSVRNFLDERIRATYLGNSIDFSRQDLSRDLAQAASLTRTHATIDLSSASDRLTCWVVERVFRRNPGLLAALVACRTRYILNEEDVTQPKLHKLRKFASMGSALTFPIQSLVFLCICLAAGASLKQGTWDLEQLSRQVRVYGDDLIVPVEWVPPVKHIMDMMWLRMNVSKSFWNGEFREACGMDAFRGYEVAPAYITQFYSEAIPSSVISVVAASNHFHEKGLWNAAAAILSTVPDRILANVSRVRDGDGSFGLLTYSGTTVHSGRNRYNERLQRWEVRRFGVKLRTTRVETDGYSTLLRYFTELPSGRPNSRDERLKHLKKPNFGCALSLIHI